MTLTTDRAGTTSLPDHKLGGMDPVTYHHTIDIPDTVDYRTLYHEERELRLSYEGEVDQLKNEARRLEKQNNLLTTAPLEFDDPRLIKIAVKAARVADSANMCPVYDLVAKGCGLPDRYWLEAHGYVTAREF